jgi:outer membrane cobalamin receptor
MRYLFPIARYFCCFLLRIGRMMCHEVMRAMAVAFIWKQQLNKNCQVQQVLRSQVLLVALFLCLSTCLSAQSNTGELRVRVVDPAGLGLRSVVELVCEANQVQRAYSTDVGGILEAKMLPFGIYRIQVRQKSFRTYSALVEIRSAFPLEFEVKLAIASNQTVVEVTDADTLVDPHRAGTINRIGQDTIQHAQVGMPGRSLIDLLNTQPGWLLESNGTLHPRGSEQSTQYVVDGIPLTDNRSAAFAPEIETDDVQSMAILTASFPAEYGKKLGGVVEISTMRDEIPGLHGKVTGSSGSFGTGDLHLAAQYKRGNNTLAFSGGAARSDRYFDPPSLDNFNNHSDSNAFSSRYERDFSNHDRLGLTIRRAQAVFQVPNDLDQQLAGQMQSRSNSETMGSFSYQHLFSTDFLGDLHVMSRDVSSRLTSNGFSTPIIVDQDRGFREGYLKTSIAAHHGTHEMKAGAEVSYGHVHELFSDVITDFSQFDDGTPVSFSFAGKAVDREQSLYAQDLVYMGHWTLSLGVRWDHYQLLVEDSGISPRLGVAWYWPRAGTIFHVSYDRAFQTPAFENLLLASSSAVIALNPQVLRVPLRPSRGNFYEAGLTKNFLSKLRVEANYYRRTIDNFPDDDVLLNTGVSVPIAFHKATIYGAESKLEIPHWGRLSAWLSYSYLVGFGYTPVTGGVFLGNDASTALNSTRFPITQDQRNTVSAGARYQLTHRLWFASTGFYGSGLPTEFDGTREQALQQFGDAIVNRVNLDRGRVRPSLSLNVAGGADLLKRDRISMSVQAQVQNINNRLNLINFAGLFSGTGIAPPRSYAMRLTASF